MGSRVRIGVEVSAGRLLWTGAHYGAHVDETGPILQEHYGTFETAVLLAGLPYSHGHIDTYDEMVKDHTEWVVLMMEEAERNGYDIKQHVRKRVFDRPAKLIDFDDWVLEDNTPGDVETVFIWRDGEWHCADIRRKAATEVGFRPLSEVMEDWKLDDTSE